MGGCKCCNIYYIVSLLRPVIDISFCCRPEPHSRRWLLYRRISGFIEHCYNVSQTVALFHVRYTHYVHCFCTATDVGRSCQCCAIMTAVHKRQLSTQKMMHHLRKQSSSRSQTNIPTPSVFPQSWYICPSSLAYLTFEHAAFLHEFTLVK